MSNEEEVEEELSRDEIFTAMWIMYQPEGGHFLRWHGAQLSWLTGGSILDDYSDHQVVVNTLMREAPQNWHNTFACSFTDNVDL